MSLQEKLFPWVTKKNNMKHFIVFFSGVNADGSQSIGNIVVNTPEVFISYTETGKEVMRREPRIKSIIITNLIAVTPSELEIWIRKP